MILAEVLTYFLKLKTNIFYQGQRQVSCDVILKKEVKRRGGNTFYPIFSLVVFFSTYLFLSIFGMTSHGTFGFAIQRVARSRHQNK